MNKVNWVTILPEAGLPVALIYDVINDSYSLVLGKPPESQKEGLY